MRRAAVQAFRTARRSPLRKVVTTRVFPRPQVNPIVGLRPVTTVSRRDAPTHIIRSSMYFRTFSVAALVSVLASGVYYYQRDTDIRALVNGTSGVTPASGFSTPRGLTVPLGSGSDPAQPLSLTSSSVAEPEAESKRRELLVQDDQFYVDELSHDAPLTKQAEDEGQNRMEKITPEQATQKLRKNEESYLVGRGRGVVRYDVVQIPSNNPIEDDHSEKIVEVPQSVAPPPAGSASSDWMFWGVFDGHSGWTTSAKLRQVLISYVARELNNTYKSAMIDPSLTVPTPQSIDTAIKRGFLALDHEIVHASLNKITTNTNQKAAAADILPQ